MAQYIPVYMDDEERNYKNKGLYDIIAFIGNQGMDENKSSEKEAYRRGKKIINSKLHKWHSVAIERLVTSEKKKYPYNGDRHEHKSLWKIHKRKAKKIFDQIYCIIAKYNNDEINKIFDTVCQKYAFQTGDYAVGNPYYRIIKNKSTRDAQKYNEEYDKALQNCANAIHNFAKYH